MRFLVLVLLLVALWLAVDNFASRLKSILTDGAAPTKGRVPPSRPAVTATLVPCEVCGTYVPSAKALKGAGQGVFCSEECRGKA
ncbi:MAG TPA: PP0621 family protein [Thermoanaerobaculia bacterium]